MNIVQATRSYEAWLARHTKVVRADLRLKHSLMTQAAFPFLRATFYRWAQRWPDVCPELAKAPEVLAVGDLHVDNFGTWRDSEGRLVWGINDFDEAAPLAYTNDLVRLATSALLAISERHLRLKPGTACAAILKGYRKSLKRGGRPYVLEEENNWLRQISLGELRDPVHFWAKMDALPSSGDKPSASVRALLKRQMPEHGLDFRASHRVAGAGGLGRERIVAVSECRGGRIAREAKALVPSAVFWAKNRSPSEIMCTEILAHAVRDPDPFYQIDGRWLIRRLSPHCSRIELSELPRDRDEKFLLFAMGWETANIHLGSRKAIRQVRNHLASLDDKWLLQAAGRMSKAVQEDWRAWRRLRRS